MPPFLCTINDETRDDSEAENDHVISESDETHSFGKNNIVLCELFNPYIHGFTHESDRNILSHYLVIGKYSTIDSPGIYEEINNIYENIDRLFINDPRFCRHPRIRNYKNIASKFDYIKPEIAECIYLSGDECVAVLKTFWLRLVQRAWKRVFQERCRMIETRSNIDHSILPSIRGMLVK
jgi:hypothetical protein